MLFPLGAGVIASSLRQSPAQLEEKMLMSLRGRIDGIRCTLGLHFWSIWFGSLLKSNLTQMRVCHRCPAKEVRRTIGI